MVVEAALASRIAVERVARVEVREVDDVVRAERTEGRSWWGVRGEGWWWGGTYRVERVHEPSP